MTFPQRIEREDEGDRIRAMLALEAAESDARIRGAFHDVASGLIAWRDCPELTARQYRRLEAVPDAVTYRPEGKETHYGTALYADPFDVSAERLDLNLDLQTPPDVIDVRGTLLDERSGDARCNAQR